jgi:hypothetical protein
VKEQQHNLMLDTGCKRLYNKIKNSEFLVRSFYIIFKGKTNV